MKRYALYLAGVFLLLILSGFGWFQYKHNLGFVCSSSMAIFDDKEQNTNILNFSQRLTFYRTGKAFSNISGEVLHDGKSYAVNRTISFEYKRLGETEYQTEVLSVVKASKDNVPEELDSIHLAPFVAGAKRIIHVNKMPNRDIVFSFNSGPYLICARH